MISPQKIYPESEEEYEKRLMAFTYHPPNSGQPKRYEAIRSQANELACLFNQVCPPSREKSLAMTKLEEAVMWANAAIARNEAKLG